MEVLKIDVEDEIYPQRLLKIKNFPTEIYALGNIELLNSKSIVAIVGSRDCTDYGRKVTNEFARELSKNEICIISGMAVGIDEIAHNAAIKEKGKTIAVIGCGFNYIYPTENEWLFHKILDKGGCVISEYHPNTKPDNKKFPIRNRIISGISDAVLVVEAMHRSGSSITAKYAKLEGKPVFAVPNSIYASTGIGTNRLIQEGGILVTKPMQIIEGLNQENYNEKNLNEGNVIFNTKKRTNKRNHIISSIDGNSLNGRIKEETKKEKVSIDKIMPKEYLQIYRIISEEAIHINEIVKKVNKPIQEIQSIITMMELEGYIKQAGTNYFKRIDLLDEII